MDHSKLLTRRNSLIALGIVVPALAVAAYFALRRPPRAQMERYAPASALAFIEIDDLSRILDGLADTKAWQELAPALGLSSQLKQISWAADLMGRTGIGPEELVLASRAQYAICITGLDAETGATHAGPYIHFKPRFAIIAETHAKPEAVSRLVRERASILAQSIYGESAVEEWQDHLGTQLLLFHGPQPERELVVAASGSIILIANNLLAAKSCLDAIEGRAVSLAEDHTLKERRRVVDHNACIFAFVTAAGIKALAELGSALLVSRVINDPEQISTVAGLFAHIAKQAVEGLLYSSEFDSGLVSERYLTVLNPQLASEMSQQIKPAPVADFKSLAFVPRGTLDFTTFKVESVGELPENLLKRFAPRLDVVAGLALRELLSELSKQLGLEDSLAGAIGDEVTLVKFDDQEPVAMLIEVRDKARLLSAVTRHLTRGGAFVSTQQLSGVEIAISSNPDGRAAAFAGGLLILGTREQVARIIAAQASGNVLADDQRLSAILTARPQGAAITSYRANMNEAAEMMLAIAKLMRVNDGSRLKLLEQDAVRAALSGVPPGVSFTEFRSYGIYTETRSAVGNFSLLGSLIEGENEIQ
jgi:hypothetical protein